MMVTAAAFGLSSCSFLHPEKKKDDKKEKKPQSKLVGRIASVSSDQKFVMIQSYGQWEVTAGSILTTQGPNERVSNLRCSGEKLGQYAAADIQAGLPATGDAVFYNPVAPSKPGDASSPSQEGFTPSLNSGSGSSPQLPQVP